MTENQAAYEELKPLIAPYREREYDKHRGKAFAHYEEHEDGSRSVTLTSGDTFHRDTRGLLRMTLVQLNGERVTTAYPMFVTPYSRWWHSLFKSYHDQVLTSILAMVQKHYRGEVSEPISIAAHRHAHVIHGANTRPGPYQQRIKHVAKNLYKLVDPSIFSLMMRVTSPRQRTSHQYNLIAALERPHELNPAILAAYVALSGRANRFEYIEYDRLDPIQVTQLVRAQLERQEGGLPRRAWRYLTRMRPRDASYVILYTVRASNLFLTALADSGETPRHTALTHLASSYVRLQQLTESGIAPHERFTQYARAVARATHKMRGIRRFITELSHANLVLDWLATDPPLTRAEGNLPLQWWRDQAQAWHDDPNGPIQQRIRREREESRHYQELQAWLEPLRQRHQRERHVLTYETGNKFEVAIPTHQTGRVTATALDTPEALAREGKDLHHCVGGYTHICLRGKSRIYSLEGNNHRSTLELTYDDFRQAWRINQHHATRNRDTTDSHKKAARELLRAYNQAHPEPHHSPLNELEARHTREMNERRLAFRPGTNPTEPKETPEALRNIKPTPVPQLVL